MSLSIKNWSVQDRPREKFCSKGRKALTDAELLAIIIGQGTRDMSAFHIAQMILASNENSLEKIKQLELQQLMKIKGIGKTKAISILSALELSNRCTALQKDKLKINQSKLVFEFVKNHFYGLQHEEFHVLFLNNSNILLDHQCISKGGITSTVADGRIIFKEALMKNATGIILIHNHPSGNPKPSDSDVNLTKNLKEFGKCVEISIFDHLIIADNFYFSFADEGIL